MRGGDRGDAAGKVESSRYPETRSTCWRSGWWRWPRWSDGRSTSCITRCDRRRRSPKLKPADLRRRARHVVRPLPSDEFAELRPRSRGTACTAARAGAAGRERSRDHSTPARFRSRALRRVLSGADKDKARRRARRRDGVRGAGRRDVPARRLDMAHRSNHARSRAGVAGARRAGQDAVLEGRRPRPPGRTGHGDRQAGARAAKDAGGPGARTAAARSRAGCAGRRQPVEVSRRSAGRRRRGARRSHHRDRTVARRHRRLARGGAVAARQPRARPVGDGRDRADPRRAGPGCRSDVVRRRVRRPLSGRPGGARHLFADSRSRRGRAARRAPAGLDGNVFGAVPRGGRPRAAAAPPPARRAGAVVAVAQARRRSARGGGTVRIVPDHSRDLSRVPA